MSEGTIVDRIIWIMTLENLTANDIGINGRSFSRVIEGKLAPSENTIKLIAAHTRVSVRWLKEGGDIFPVFDSAKTLSIAFQEGIRIGALHSKHGEDYVLRRLSPYPSLSDYTRAYEDGQALARSRFKKRS